MMERFPVKSGPSTPVQFAQRFAMGKHEGTDIFAPAGAELVAVADGRVRHAKEKRGGFAAYLTEPDGTQYYYAHLDAFAYPLMPGETSNVKAGDPIGYVGTTGNAKGGPPHVHFEYRPKGGAKRDPFPMLTRLSKTEAVRVRTKQTAKKPSRAAPSRTTKKRPPSRPKQGASGLGMLFFLYVLAKGLGNA